LNIRLQQFITRFCILGALLTPSFVWAADIESVRLWRAPDSTRLVLDLSTAAEHNLFALQNPNRLVIDLSDSQLKTQFDKLDLANTPISGIRAAVRNNTDVRVVLDLKTKVSPKSFSLRANEQYSDRLVIDLFDKKRVVSRSVEEVVKKTEKQIEEEIAEVGKRTVIDLGIHGLHPELIKAVGRMKYRSSYGQNLLQHSREVAKLCGVMAAELGINAKLAKRAGLLHDIGKVPHSEADAETPHAILGMQWAEKYGEKPDICNAIGAHHDEIEMKTLIAPIVQVCDAISGARPGARRQVLDSYIQRLKDLEDIAFGFKGVQKAYAIQAGRELRVIVESEKVSDEQAMEMSFEISQKIQTDMTYPGQVKVTVIRETRAVNVAK